MILNKQKKRELRKLGEIVAAMRGDEPPPTLDFDALSYLRSVYNDPTAPSELRAACARWAINYERPALSVQAVGVADVNTGLADRLNAAIARVSRAGDGDPVALLAADSEASGE